PGGAQEQRERRATGGPTPPAHAAPPRGPLFAEESEAALQVRVTDGAVHVDDALFEALEQIQVERPLVDDVADLHADPIPEQWQDVRQGIHRAVDGLAETVPHGQRFEEGHDHVRAGADAPDAEGLAEVLTALENAEDVLGGVEQAADSGRAVDEEA